jgi:alpha-tubulin suppressor-like RCC1 family protein
MAEHNPGRTLVVVFAGLVGTAFFGIAPACHLVTGVDHFSTDPSLDVKAPTSSPCVTSADCIGENTECSFQACIDSKCTSMIAPEGTAVKEQVTADCKVNQCDGAGKQVEGVDSTDILDDGKECTIDECSAAGEPTNAPAAAGTKCALDTMVCDGKGACVECALDTDCTTVDDVCSMNHCVPKICVNQMKDTGESDVDCGGTICSPCGTGLVCVADSDCQSKFCKMGKCAEPSCTDQVKNGDETDVDCGGNCPMDCADGLGCLTGADCTSKVCTTNLCQKPVCDDGVQNGTEIGTDCGKECPGCGAGISCTTHMDCASEFCWQGKCTKIIQVAAGTAHACAVVATDPAMNNGQAFCWGGNAYGDLGVGSIGTALSRPTQPVSLTNVTSVSSFANTSAMAAIGGHTCARHLDAGGVAKFSCWGRNENGQLGTGNKTHSIQPKGITLAAGAEPIQVIAGGRHTCAITNIGHVQCWGANGQGQLGNNSTTANFETPQIVKGTNVPTPLNAIQIALGTVHTCARVMDGSVYCWGENERGQVGIGTSTDKEYYPKKLNLTGITQLSSGQDFTCGLLNTALFCWGDNSDKQLSGNVDGFFSGPTSFPNPSSVQSLPLTLGASGVVPAPDLFGGHSCFVVPDGKLVCRGLNDRGQLGIGSTMNASTPTEVTIDPVEQVALGMQFSCAILKKGPLRCWGRNELGQLGNGATTDSNVPVPVQWL